MPKNEPTTHVETKSGYSKKTIGMFQTQQSIKNKKHRNTLTHKIVKKKVSVSGLLKFTTLSYSAS